jgi:hypothetical protein
MKARYSTFACVPQGCLKAASRLHTSTCSSNSSKAAGFLPAAFVPADFAAPCSLSGGDWSSRWMDAAESRFAGCCCLREAPDLRQEIHTGSLR